MAIILLPSTVEDASEMLETGLAAFANDKLNLAQFNMDTATPEQMDEFRAWRRSLSHARMTGPGKHWFKAVDDSNGRLVGSIGIYDPHVVAPDPLAFPHPSHTNIEITKELRSKMKAVKEKHIGDRDDVWYVQSMVVHPDYQGQGIAGRLLERGLEEVDRAQQDIYLEGTAAGRRLYLRHGFKDLEDIDMELVDYKIVAMMRHPQKSVAG